MLSHGCPHPSRVIPAKAGIQVLNGIARTARDSEQLIAVPRTAGGFLSLLVQRKKPKKARPGAADFLLRFSGKSALA
jgi:hypothetical protein